MKKVHVNSITTYHDGRAAMTERAGLIYDLVLRVNGEMTDREIMKALGFTDMNAVRPRITELVESGWLRETRNCVDELTGRPVRLVKARTMDEMIKLGMAGQQAELSFT